MQRRLQHGVDEVCLRKRIALPGFKGRPIVGRRQPALQFGVLSLDRKMASQAVTEGKVPAFLLCAAHAEMAASVLGHSAGLWKNG